MAEPAYPLILPPLEGDRTWPAQGEWTYEDYYRLPDDGRRYEVIRGNLYVTAAPTIDHQRTLGRLLRRLDDFVEGHHLGEVLMAPADVLLPEGIAAPVQPDLLFFRTGNQPAAGAVNFQGVPDLVVEVLSPGTRRYDATVKLAAYRDAGVPEVWIADPQRRTLTVYGFGEDRREYVELSLGGEGESVSSRALPGLSLAVAGIFPR